jgi:hypothetical protein
VGGGVHGDGPEPTPKYAKKKKKKKKNPKKQGVIILAHPEQKQLCFRTSFCSLLTSQRG